MNKLTKFYIYTGMLRYVGSDCYGMHCYKKYKYRKWHPLLWVMLLIAMILGIARAIIEMVSDLKGGALDGIVECPTKNTIREPDGRRKTK